MKDQKMDDKDFCKLVDQYTSFFHKKFKHEWKLFVEVEDIRGELAITGCKVRNEYKDKTGHSAKVKTVIIRSFVNRMNDYRKYLYQRQVKNPTVSITEC